MISSNLAYQFKYLVRYCRETSNDYSQSKYYEEIKNYLLYDKHKLKNISSILESVDYSTSYLENVKNNLLYLINISDILKDIEYMSEFQDVDSHRNLKKFINEMNYLIRKFDKHLIDNLIKDSREVLSSMDENSKVSKLYKHYLQYGVNETYNKFNESTYDDKLILINLLINNNTSFDKRNINKLLSNTKLGVRSSELILRLIIDCRDSERLVNTLDKVLIYQSLDELSYVNTKINLVIEFIDDTIHFLPRNSISENVIKMFCRMNDEHFAVLYLEKLFSNFDIKIHSENLLYGNCLINDASFILKYLYSKNINMKGLGGLVFHEALYDKKEKCLKEILKIYKMSTLKELVNSETSHRIFLKSNKTIELKNFIEAFDRKLVENI